MSNADFTIARTPAVTVTSPANGASWLSGTVRQIAWSHNLGLGGLVRIERSVDGGATWAVIADRVASTGATTGVFDWVVSNTNTTSARIRVTGLNGRIIGASGSYTIQQPKIALTVSTASANWTIGKPKAITWTHNLPVGTTMTVQISYDGGKYWVPLAQVVATGSSESFNWTVTGPSTGVIIGVSAPAYSVLDKTSAFDIR